jgi:hypothetical protein
MPLRPNWFDMVYPQYSSSMSSTDDYTIPSPTSVQVPNLRPASADHNIRWSLLFPSAPIVVERQATESGLLLRSDTPAPMSSPARSVLSYAGNTFICEPEPYLY